MKRTIVVLSIMIFFFVLTSVGFCTENSKIGIIDFQRIVKESSAGKIFQKEFKTKGEEFQKAILAEKKLLEDMQSSIEREALVLSPEKQQEKQREFRIRANDYKKMQQDLERKFKQLELTKRRGIQKKVFEIATEIGQKENYTIILEKQAGGVIYYNNQFDITDQIIKQYNLIISTTN